MAKSAAGFTLIELLIVVAIVGVISAVAVPGLVRSRMSGNEASAIGSVRAIISAQHDYEAFHHGYATDLADLATACPGSPMGFISLDLNANGVTKNGFRYALGNSPGASDAEVDCHGTMTKDRYYASAEPLAIGSTGTRAFAANVNHTIWQDTSGVPPTEPFAVGGTVTMLGR